MTIDKMTATDMVQASTKYNTMPEDQMTIQGHYSAVCYSVDGFVKWADEIENLVTTVGKNLTLDTILGNVAAGAVVMGLKGVGTAVVTDTQASHSTWLEVGLANAPTYSGNRPTPSFSAASAGSKTTSSAVSFSITGTGTAVAADTQASHASWLEVGGTNAPAYSGNRPTPSFSAASSGSKATSSAVSFSITSTGNVFGCFINIGGSATKDSTTGTLFSAGDFSSSKSVINGDTIAVTYTATLT